MASPLISVCAPYWNRPTALRDMLFDYGERYPDLDLEISIADDGSVQPARLLEGARHRVIITRLPAKTVALNPCVPINRAVDASRGEIIVLTNPEVRHERQVLQHLVALVRNENDYATAVCLGFGYGRDTIQLAGPDVDYSAHGRLPVPSGAHFHFLAAFRRELWEKAGGFDEDYRHFLGADDNDWLWRAHRAGAVFHELPIFRGWVWQPKGTSGWNLPHGRTLFFRKWPEAITLV